MTILWNDKVLITQNDKYELKHKMTASLQDIKKKQR